MVEARKGSGVQFALPLLQSDEEPQVQFAASMAVMALSETDSLWDNSTQ